MFRAIATSGVEYFVSGGDRSYGMGECRPSRQLEFHGPNIDLGGHPLTAVRAEIGDVTYSCTLGEVEERAAVTPPCQNEVALRRFRRTATTGDSFSARVEFFQPLWPDGSVTRSRD